MQIHASQSALPTNPAIKSEVSEYAKVVLLYPRSSLSHKLYPPLLQMPEAIEIIVQCSIECETHGVDGEVTTEGV